MSASTLVSRANAQEDAAPDFAVRVQNLTKLYGVRPILRGVSFELGAGRTLVVLGPNGAGKTTLLRVLATLTKPSGGSVRIGSLDVERDADQVRRIIGYVGHQPGVYDELTPRENLRFFARMYGVAESRARADELLRRVGLLARAEQRTGTLSRGQAQRLALARGILHRPKLLLLDEPDTGLDEEATALMSELVAEHTAAGGTTILTTHNLERGFALADDALALVAGRVALAGSTRDLSPAEVRLALAAKGGAR